MSYLPPHEPMICIKADTHTIPYWYVIERRNHEGVEWWVPTKVGRAEGEAQRWTGSIVDWALEGHGADMRAIGEAILNKQNAETKRVAIEWHPEHQLWSIWRPSDEGRKHFASHIAMTNLYSSICDALRGNE